LLNEPAFHLFDLPEKARDLTQHLFKLLTETFSKSLAISDNKRLTAPLKQEDTQKALLALINDALKLKKDLLLVADNYRLLHIEPGAAFDDRVMVDEDAGEFDAPKIPVPPWGVKICLWPGLMFCSGSPSTSNEDMRLFAGWEQALVQNRIQREEEEGVDPETKHIVLCKAVVLLDKSP
jgi:hypothetical protein